MIKINGQIRDEVRIRLWNILCTNEFRYPTKAVNRIEKEMIHLIEDQIEWDLAHIIEEQCANEIGQNRQ